MTLVHSPSAHTQPGSAKTVADILTAAADLIDKPGAWTQHVFAKSSPDATDHLSGYDPKAVCWCALGAMEAAAGEELSCMAIFGQAETFLVAEVGNVPSWNDAPNRTQAEVVAALRAAADKARTDSSVGIAKGDEPK